MRLYNSFSDRPRLPIGFILMMVVVLGSFNVASAATKKETKKEEEKKESPQYVVTGRDPKAFSDAATMLSLPNQRLLSDQEVNRILGALDALIGKSEPWSPAIWAQLDQLRSVRMSATQIQSLQKTGQKMVIKETRPSREKSAAARQSFVQGNRHYDWGVAEQAIESYRTALGRHPVHWDAWNNMALAEMHLNNDLLALFLLSALTKSNPKYSGAPINLSVCLERLGHEAAAYKVAADLASEHTHMPMAQYNMAWFENSRGKYDSANGCLGKALAAVDNYSVAKWLQTINTMESGRNVSDEGIKSLPPSDRIQGKPKVTARYVVADKADAYSGNSVVAQIPKGTQLAISQQSGSWYAVYWNVQNTKRRLWVHKSSLRDIIATVSNDLGPFLGTWTGNWRSIREKGITVTEVARRPKVTMYNDTASSEKLENGRLSFNVKEKGSGYEFVYTLVPTHEGLILDVFRARDSLRVSVNLTKK